MVGPGSPLAPLSGRRILITRSRAQSGSLQRLLEAAGAQVLALPLLDLAPPDDWTEIDETISRLGSFAWVVFTSANGARFLLQRLRESGLGPEAFGAARVAAVGPATAVHLEQAGLAVDLLPEEHSQEGLARAFARIPVEGQEILLPSSSLSRPMLAAALEQRGARVHQVVAYQNRPPDPSQVEVPAALLGGQVDMAVFASPSSVEHFGELLGCDRALALLSPLALACIGPSTADAVRRLGLQVQVQPERSSAAELAKAICAYYEIQTP